MKSAVVNPIHVLQDGYLDDPPNVDFLDIEYEDEGKVQIRKEMILNMTTKKEITTIEITGDEVSSRADVFLFGCARAVKVMDLNFIQ